MTFNPKEARDPNGRWTHLAGLLKSQGGFTHNLIKNAEESKGFAVSIPGHEETFKGHANADTLKAYASRHRGVLAQSDNRLGGWFNPDDGKSYIDVSRVHGDFKTAFQKAKERKEIALYDLDTGNTYHTLTEDWQPHIDAMKGTDLKGLDHAPVDVPGGHGKITFHSNKDLQEVAAKYNRDHGLGPHPTDYSTVDKHKAELVAQAYDEMKHDPENPEVKRAYAALKKEVMQQYKAVTDAGYEYHFYPEGGDPYADTPREATYDLAKNKKMFVFPTLGPDGGFGTGDDAPPADHPLLEKVPGLKWDGKDVTYNDVFRAVHDSVTHAKEGLGFNARGEDNTFRQHYSMFSPEAQKAIASETRGQNTWMNFGPPAKHNALGYTTIFAPQKAGILPAWARDPDFLRKDKSHKDKEAAVGKKKIKRDLATPVTHGDFELAKGSNGLAFWKQILPLSEINYTAKDGSRQKINFDRQYLTDLASNKAVDDLPFVLADSDNRHTMDPERVRGSVRKLEVRDDGLYGKIVFPNEAAAAAVINNPELGVSARIRENIQRSDGSTLSRGLIHVLGTLDPQVGGMSPWQPTDLSTEQGEVLDLTSEEYEEMPKSTEPKAVEDYTDAEIEAMNEEELDAFLKLAGIDLDAVESEDEDDTEATDEVDEDETAGAELSKTASADIQLANQRAERADRRAAEALARLAQESWNHTRETLLSAGVPPHALDLAAPVLNRSDDMVIDLSVTDEDDVNVSEVVRGLLDALKGTVDLSNEQGHNGTWDREGDDPDKALLDLWDKQQS